MATPSPRGEELTNEAATISKRSVERAGYFKEPHFLRPFASKFQKRSPQINLGYSIRCQAIEEVIDQFLEKNSGLPAASIINLGCGYDSTFFRLANRSVSSDPASFLPTRKGTDPEPASSSRGPKHLYYIDVDFPDLLTRKRACINRTSELLDLLNLREGAKVDPLSWVQSINKTCSYATLDCDLRETSKFERTFGQLLDSIESKKRYQMNILFVSEVALVYMEPCDADSILKIVSSYPRSSLLLLEQFLPDHPKSSPYASTMLDHFSRSVKTPLKCLEKYTTLETLKRRYEDVGWNRGSGAVFGTLERFWTVKLNEMDEESRRKFVKEPFDEWEELQLFLKHYYVVLASNGVDLSLCGSFPQVALSKEPSPNTPGTCLDCLSHRSILDSKFIRKGSTLTRLGPGKFLLFGGYGLPCTLSKNIKGNQTRLSETALLNLSRTGSSRLSLVTLPNSSSSWPAPRVHHSANLVNGNAYIFGGRSGPDTPFDDLWVFDPSTKAWREVKRLESQTAPWPKGRFRHASAVVSLPSQEGSNERFVVHGGIGQDRVVLDDLWLFDPDACSWRELSIEGVGSRHSHQLVSTTKDRILFLGGMNQEQNVMPPALCKIDLELERLIGNAIGFSGKDDPTMAYYQRFGARVVQFPFNEQQVLAIGGVALESTSTLDQRAVLLDINSRTWTPIQLSASEDILVEHAIVFDFDGTDRDTLKLILAGGGANCFSFGSHFDASIRIFSSQPFLAPSAPSSLSAPQISLRPCDPLENGATSAHDTWNRPTPVARVNCQTREDWEKILDGRQPVVIEGLSLGSAPSRWSREYLSEKCGHRKVSIHVSSSQQLAWHDRNFKYTTVKMSEFLERAFRDNDGLQKETTYLRSLSHNARKPTVLEEDFPELAGDFLIPPQIDISKEFFSSPLRISSPNMSLWGHMDVADNLLFQVIGEKQILLWHPREMDRLYIRGSSSPILDPTNPDLTRYPLFRFSNPVIATLKPNEALFIPSVWIHAVKTMTPSISVNVFFKRLEQRGLFGKNDIWGNQDLQPFVIAKAEIIKMVEQQKGLLGDKEQASYLQRVVNELVQMGDDGTVETDIAQRAKSLLRPLNDEQCSFYLKKLASEIVQMANDDIYAESNDRYV